MTSGMFYLQIGVMHERPSSPEKIIEKVCSELHVPVKNILTKSRKRELVFARQLSMYFIKKRTRLSLKSIGELFPGKNGKPRDHTTVIHSMQTIKDLMVTDPFILGQVQKIGGLV